MRGDLILHGDNLALMADFADGAFRMVYADPPFNTGRAQTRSTVRVTPDAAGDRTGFGGRRYRTELLERSSYRDSFDDYLGFLEPRLREIRRLLDAEGTLYLHLDQREAHYVKLLLDEVFGRDSFLNELVWAYDYGAKPKRRWPAKHDTILVYVRDPGRYLFDSEAVEREPYMAPGLVTAEKAARGKLPTDVWWHTIVSPTGREKTGYPTQKPVGHRAPDAPGVDPPGRPGARPVRRLGHARRRRGGARPALRADRRERGGRRGHAGGGLGAPAPERRRA